jgi:5-methyltetrahydrofolate--homocysteine methyltransferase
MIEKLSSIYKGILDGNVKVATQAVNEALWDNIPAEEILQDGLISAMDEVGRLFEEGEYYVPEMLLAARAMKAGLSILKPLLIESGIEPAGKVVIGTVQGDLHDIGKNLVGIMLEGAGFAIKDLGTDVAPEQFVAAVGDGVDILGLSALLTTTMPNIENTIKAIKEAGLRDKVKIIVGGALMTPEYAKKIGADGFAADASQATTLAKSLIA